MSNFLKTYCTVAYTIVIHQDAAASLFKISLNYNRANSSFFGQS